MAQPAEKNRSLRWDDLWQRIFDGPLAFIFVLSLALFLRVISIQGRGLTYDDAFSILLSQQTFSNIISGTAADTMPPLYYFCLHIWMGFGHQVWFIRVLNVIINLGTIGFLYGVVKSLWGRPAGLWAGLFAAISPLQIYHAQDIRMYALLAFTQMGYLFFFLKIWKKGTDQALSRWMWVGLVFFGVSALYTHNLAILLLAAPNLVLIIRREWKVFFRLVAAQLVIVIAALPWLLVLPGQIAKVQRAFWTPKPGLIEILQSIIFFHASLPLPVILMAVAVILSAQVVALLILTLVKQSQRDPGILLLVCATLLPPILLFIISYAMRPVYVTRAFITSSLAYDGLLGWMVTRGKVRGVRFLAAGMVVFLAISTLPSHYSFDEFPRSPFQSAMDAIASEIEPGDVVIHDNKLSYFPSIFYAPEVNQRFIADEPGSANDTLAVQTQEAMNMIPKPDIASAALGGNRIFFVVFDQTIKEYQEMGKTNHPSILWLDAHYQKISQQHFNDLEVIKYERP